MSGVVRIIFAWGMIRKRLTSNRVLDAWIRCYDVLICFSICSDQVVVHVDQN